MVRYDQVTALLVVDVQNDFADPAGSLYVQDGERVVPVIDDEVAAARAMSGLIVYTQDWHPPTTPHFATNGGVWPVHCVQDTWGAALHPGLRVARDAPVVRKGAGDGDGYSAFSVRSAGTGDVAPTLLESVLRDKGIQRIVVCGLATDYCVVETVLDARRLGYAVTVLSDAIRAVNLEPGDDERALERIRETGAKFA